MARAATRWAYGPKVLAQGLSASELALLRALSWAMNLKKGRTKPLTDKDLSVLTGYTGRQTLTNARNRLRELNLIAFEHANRVKDRETHEAVATSIGYVYYVKFVRPPFEEEV